MTRARRPEAGPTRRRLLATAAALPWLGWTAEAAAEAEAANAPAAADRTRVAFMGDSMADGLWGAFVRSFARDRCLRDGMDGGRYARNGTGLTRTEGHDWVAQARKIVDGYAPGAVVASIGLNDRQDLAEGGRVRVPFGTPAWDEAYRARAGEFLKAAASNGAAVMLVGLPAMRDAAQHADAQAKNKLFAEAVAAAGDARIGYVEPWQVPGAPGTYATAVPGEGGRGLVQARAPDGIHFTMAGYDLVWAYLFPKLAAKLKETGRKAGLDCAGP